MPDGINSLNLKMDALSMKEDKLLESKVLQIHKIDKLLERTETTENTKRGAFSM